MNTIIAVAAFVTLVPLQILVLPTVIPAQAQTAAQSYSSNLRS